MKNIDTIACILFDGGWRHDDKIQLMEEHNLNSDIADEICRLLAELEIAVMEAEEN